MAAKIHSSMVFCAWKTWIETLKRIECCLAYQSLLHITLFRNTFAHIVDGRGTRKLENGRFWRKSYEYTPTPGAKALKPHQEASKSLSSIITQLRTGKIGLNAYLHSRKVPGFDSPNCGCGYRLQSIEYILLSCRKYGHLRRYYLGPGRMTLGEVLSDSSKIHGGNSAPRAI